MSHIRCRFEATALLTWLERMCCISQKSGVASSPGWQCFHIVQIVYFEILACVCNDLLDTG